MKKKLRRQLKDCYQIGNYIYSGLNGEVKIVIAKGEILTDVKIASDFNYLIKFYGVDYAYFFLKTINEYIKK